MIMLILRHAWLNLWDKHMTTGRINQVSKIQSSMFTHQRLKITYEFTFSMLLRHANLHSAWAHRILLLSHFSSNHNYNLRNASRKSKLPDQAPHGFPRNAIGCETRNSSKVRIQILKHFATPKSCRLEKLYLPTRTCCFTRETNNNAELKNFFNAKAHTSELNNFRRFILLPLHEECKPSCLATSPTCWNYLPPLLS